MRRSLLLAVTSALLIAPAAANASDAAVRAAILVAGHEVKASPELQAAVAKLTTDPKTLAKVEAATVKFVEVLRKAAHTVEETKATSAKGKAGEADWLNGVRTVARAFEDLRFSIVAVKAHEKTVAKAKLKAAATDLKTGADLSKRGRQLLGLSTK
jgi:hypothetical protein